MDTISIFWFRRDLRLHDNVALYHALQSEEKILPIFIFDKDILEQKFSQSNSMHNMDSFVEWIFTNE